MVSTNIFTGTEFRVTVADEETGATKVLTVSNDTAYYNGESAPLRIPLETFVNDVIHSDRITFVFTDDDSCSSQLTSNMDTTFNKLTATPSNHNISYSDDIINASQQNTNVEGKIIRANKIDTDFARTTFNFWIEDPNTRAETLVHVTEDTIRFNGVSADFTVPLDFFTNQVLNSNNIFLSIDDSNGFQYVLLFNNSATTF